MSKEDYILEIISFINKNFKDSKTKAAFFIIGDGDVGKAVSDLQGDMNVLGQSFGNMMRVKPEFNRVMKALMGSYLSQHPEERIEFIKGLELVKDTPSLN